MQSFSFVFSTGSLDFKIPYAKLKVTINGFRIT